MRPAGGAAPWSKRLGGRDRRAVRRRVADPQHAPICRASLVPVGQSRRCWYRWPSAVSPGAGCASPGPEIAPWIELTCVWRNGGHAIRWCGTTILLAIARPAAWPDRTCWSCRLNISGVLMVALLVRQCSLMPAPCRAVASFWVLATSLNHPSPHFSFRHPRRPAEPCSSCSHGRSSLQPGGASGAS